MITYLFCIIAIYLKRYGQKCKIHTFIFHYYYYRWILGSFPRLFSRSLQTDHQAHAQAPPCAGNVTATATEGEEVWWGWEGRDIWCMCMCRWWHGRKAGGGRKVRQAGSEAGRW